MNFKFQNLFFKIYRKRMHFVWIILLISLQLTACGGGVQDHFSQKAPDSPIIKMVVNNKNQWLLLLPETKSAQQFIVYWADNEALKNATELVVDNTRNALYVSDVLSSTPAGQSVYFAAKARWEGKNSSLSSVVEYKSQPVSVGKLEIETLPGRIVISWTGKTEESTSATYHIYQSSLAALDVNNYETVTIVSDNRYIFDSTGIVTNQRMYFMVTKEAAGVESVISNIVDSKVLPPLEVINTPQNLKAVREQGGIRISWSKVDDVQTYQLYRTLDAEFNSATADDFTLETLFYLDEATETGIAYYYWITATKENLLSDRSDFVMVPLLAISALPNLSIENVNTKESDKFASFTLTLDKISSIDISVSYRTENKTATAPEDYLATNDTITLKAGELSVTENISLGDDVFYEGDETFTIIFTDVNDALLENSQIMVTIVDDETPMISVADKIVDEGDGIILVEVKLSAPTDRAVSVSYALTSDNATEADDYQLKDTSINPLIFNAGETSKTIEILISEDRMDEIDEILTLTFSNAINAGLSNEKATVTINDNDDMPVVSIEASQSIIETNQGVVTVELNVSLSQVSGKTVQVFYATQDGTATFSGGDYQNRTDQLLTFNLQSGETKKNQMISIDISGDSDFEIDENFNVILSSAIGATIGDRDLAVVTIQNDDAPDAPVFNLKNGDGQVTLTWPSAAGVTGYNIYYARQSGVVPGNYGAMDGTMLADQTSGRKLTLDDLKYGVDYYFIVTALAGNLESVPAAEKTVRTKIDAKRPLNDTGIRFAGNYPTGNNIDCTGETIDQQDCKHGRDDTQNDNSNGHAGFDYTKLDSKGNDFGESAGSWRCVRDNITGLIWEVKTNDGLLRDAAHTYTWYNSSEINDNLEVGTANGGKCVDSSNCDTEKYVKKVNAGSLCGASDWRIPTIGELGGLVNFNRFDPAIDIKYFPNKVGLFYWSSSPNVDNSGSSWFVYFTYGYSLYYGNRDYGRSVRLVRSDNP